MAAIEKLIKEPKRVKQGLDLDTSELVVPEHTTMHPCSCAPLARSTIQRCSRCPRPGLRSHEKSLMLGFVRDDNLLHDVEGEGADLLEGVDGDLVLQPAVPPLLQQVIVHLARADQDLAQTQHKYQNCRRTRTMINFCRSIAARFHVDCFLSCE